MDESLSGLREFVTDLRTADLDDFADTVARGVCEQLGFSKSMFSWVRGSTWAPDCVYVTPGLGDPFDQLVRAVDGSPVPLLRAPREADLVRYRRPYLLGRKHFHVEAYRPLIDLSDPAGYAAAPIVMGDRTVAILHIDHHDDGVDEEDLGLLSIATRLCGSAYSTLVARRRLDDQRSALAEMFDAALAPSAKGHSFFAGDAQSTGVGPAPDRDEHRNRSLTEREDTVLRLVASGASNKAIAGQLFITEATVKSHVRRIFRKLRIDTRAQAAVYYRAQSPGSAVPA
ncbi:regulatory LuxR family protein [Williamsia limnetica]|uniref:Regulatory LuxR family protein n=1 Tax=Williamsia limnetica TaxID=882452 RepID=A0A318RGL9_WILLI|nr:LuxR C-terminal-related transcriptional regulator [Williamsia limnetica]PYE12333.1 regulatory LuxR family protein [Williamsia limnetica]